MCEPAAHGHETHCQRRSRWIRFSIRLAMSLALIAIFLSRTSWEQLASMAHQVDLGPLILALVAFLIVAGLEIARLRFLFHTESVSRLFRIHCVGHAIAFAGPGLAGADAYRALSLRGSAGSVLRSATLIVITRLIGIGLTLTSAVAAAFVWPALRTHTSSLARLSVDFQPVSLLIIGVVASTIAIGAAAPATRRWAGRWIRDVHSTAASVSAFQWGQIAAVSGGIVACRAAVVQLLSAAVGAPTHFVPAVFAAGLATVAAILPLTLGGVGAREGALAVSLIWVGIPESVAIAIALANRAFLLLPTITGALFLRATR
jgi:uncharacterized membrane protein YbhN (UPF0104 family)